MLLTSAVYAENSFTASEISFKNGLIFVSGTTSSANMSVAVSAVKNGADKGDVSALCYVDEILSDNGAKYEISFNLKDAPTGETLTGDYVLYVKCGGKSTQLPFKYSDYTAVLNLIISAESDDEIKNILANKEETDSLKALGFDMDLYGLLDESGKSLLCGLFYNGGVGTNAETVSEKFTLSLGTALVCTKDEKNVLQGLKLVNPTVGDVKFGDVTDEIYISFTVLCVALDDVAKDLNGVSESFKKADALYKINTASAGKISEIITDNAEILKITNSDEYKRWRNLSDKDAGKASVNLVNSLGKTKVKTVSALLDAMDRAGTFEPGGGGGGSSSGGSSKGSSSGGNYNLSGTNTVALPTEKFSDLSLAAWAKDAILTLADKNIILGYGDGTFLPNNHIKREEFTKIIVVAFKTEDFGGDINFADINENDWFYPFVKKAYNAGIVKGVNDVLFGTSSYVTRQDIAVMLSRVLEKYGENLEFTKDYTAFADENEISAYALNSVKALCKLGVISGYEDGTFRPAGSATRAEAAYMINSILNILK